MAFSWENLPEDIRSCLLQGGVGGVHLHGAANAVFQAINQAESAESRADFYALGCDLLVAAWEGEPLSPALARTLLELHKQRPFLDSRRAGLLRFCSRQPEPDEATANSLNLAAVRDLERFEALLSKAQRDAPFQFYLIRQAIFTAMRENRLSWLRRFLDRDAALPAPFKKAFLADAAFAEEKWDEAAAGYATAFEAIDLPAWRTRRAESLYRAGQCDEAVRLWRDVHSVRPWNVNVLLRLSDVLQGRDQNGPFPAGQGAVLLYTWNKSGDIDATLESLSRTELEHGAGQAKVFVLDNGSTDATPEILRKWERLFAGRLHIVSLPVNVGAPAARNWLLALPEVRAADWAAFLDDDVAVPTDWLRHLQAALTAFPEAGVASGHAVDHHAPMTAQWTDMHIIPLPVPDGDDSRVFRDRFKFTSLHEQHFDFGEFNFMRPCVTAIGCCHIFTRKAMDEGGFFDVRFSPSQSDDVDHDLRRCLSGHMPVYNGHLRILHKRTTGYHKTPNRRSWASAVGNWYKLQASYTEEDVRKVYELDQRLMLEDVLGRESRLAKDAD